MADSSKFAALEPSFYGQQKMERQSNPPAVRSPPNWEKISRDHS
jgi:hypothetical protein